MIHLLLASDVAKEASSLPLALKIGATAYLGFAVVVFAVTRLNRDR